MPAMAMEAPSLYFSLFFLFYFFSLFSQPFRPRYVHSSMFIDSRLPRGFSLLCMARNLHRNLVALNIYTRIYIFWILALLDCYCSGDAEVSLCISFDRLSYCLSWLQDIHLLFEICYIFLRPLFAL